MKALVITANGAREVLRIEERADSKPGPGQVRIAMCAAGINFADLVARVGIYPDAPKPPAVVGYEVAGEVEALGEGVNGAAAGDRVIAGTRFGGYAERAVTAAANVIPLPEGWSYEEGAALPVSYATAKASRSCGPRAGSWRRRLLGHDRRSPRHPAASRCWGPRRSSTRSSSCRPRAVIGLNLLTLWDDRGTLDEYIEPLREWAEAGRIRPLVAEVFPPERGADAHRDMQEGRNTGRVVLTV